MVGSLEGRGKIRTAIIHPDENIIPLLEDIVQSHQLLFHLGSWTSPNSYFNSFSNEAELPQIYIIGRQFPEERKDVLGIINDIRSFNKKANFTIVTPQLSHADVDYGSEDYKSMLRDHMLYLDNGEHIFGVLPEDSSVLLLDRYKNKFKERVKRLIESGKVSRKLRLVQMGMGDLGEQISREFYQETWLEKLFWHSEDNPDVAFEKYSYQDKSSVERIQVGLEEFFEQEGDSLDGVIISRGEKVNKYKTDRAKIIWNAFPGTIKKVCPVLEAMQKTGKDIFTLFLSNPPGPHMWVAHNEYGFQPHSISSIPVDLHRAKYVLQEFISGSNSVFNGEKVVHDIAGDVLGEHGVDIAPVWDEFTMWGKPMHDILRFYNINRECFSSNEELLVERIVNFGTDLKDTEKRTGKNSFDVAREVKKFFWKVAHYQQSLDYSIYREASRKEINRITRPDKYKFPFNNTHIILPSAIEYYPSIMVRGNEEYNLDENVRRRVANAFKSQADYIKKYLELKKGGFFKKG